LSPPGTLDAQELTPAAAAPAASAGSAVLPFPAPLSAITQAAARAAVDLHAGNKSAAARQLGISRSRLQRLLDRTDDGTEDGDE
jgi:DNA-binding NtrC family response regulator